MRVTPPNPEERISPAPRRWGQPRAPRALWVAFWLGVCLVGLLMAAEQKRRYMWRATYGTGKVHAAELAAWTDEERRTYANARYMVLITSGLFVIDGLVFVWAATPRRRPAGAPTLTEAEQIEALNDRRLG